MSPLWTSRGLTVVRAFIFVLFGFSTVAVGLGACEGCRSVSPPGPPAVAFAEDSTPTVRLYLVTDLAGALEPCGCTTDQLGGLDHFGAWVSQSRRSAQASFVATAGPLFFLDPELASDRAGQDRAKARTIARVLRRLGLVAFAPGANDWVDGAQTLEDLASESGAMPLVSDQVSRLGEGPQAGTRRTLVRAVGGVGASAGLRVAFVGFGQPPPPASGPENAEQELRRDVDAAKAQGANVLIALCSVGRGEAKRIADAIPELTAVVVGSPRLSGEANTSGALPERVGDVLIIQGANHLQSVTVLDLFVRGKVAPGVVIKFADATGSDLALRRADLTSRIDDLHIKIAAWTRDQNVSKSDLDARRRDLVSLEHERDALDVRPVPVSGSFLRFTVKEIRESLGKDSAIESDLESYYRTVNDRNRIELANRLPVPAAKGAASYMGAEACFRCHPGPRDVWLRTPHAKAYATLTSEFKEFNLECVSCHVTGYERPGGSTVTHVEHLQNVQCEVCHGPGSLHASDPSNRSLIVGKPSEGTCIACHHSPHVEQFDAHSKMAEVLGPGHGK